MSTAEDFRASQVALAPHQSNAGADQATEPTTSRSLPTKPTSVRSKKSDPSHHLRDDHDDHAGVGPNIPPAPNPNTLSTDLAALADPFLYLLAQVLDDLERTRVANENRVRQLTRNVEDADGEERGFGLTEDHPDVARLAGIVDALTALEHGAELNLKRALRRHPLGQWVKNTVGVGEKQGARLLAAIGDPYWNTLYDRPRTVSELWAYSGLHVVPASQMADDAPGVHAGGVQDSLGHIEGVPLSTPAEGAQTSHTDQARSDAQQRFVGVAAKRRKGEQSRWSSAAKMRAYLVATSCIKQSASPYRAVYDARRARTAITHPDWTLGHSHNDGLRIVSKAVLKDLWRAAREIHKSTA